MLNTEARHLDTQKEAPGTCGDSSHPPWDETPRALSLNSPTLMSLTWTSEVPKIHGPHTLSVWMMFIILGTFGGAGKSNPRPPRTYYVGCWSTPRKCHCLSTWEARAKSTALLLKRLERLAVEALVPMGPLRLGVGLGEQSKRRCLDFNVQVFAALR